MSLTLTISAETPRPQSSFYERDRTGNLAAVTDGTGRRTFERDDHGRETAEHLADGWTIRREYWPDNGQPRVVRLSDPEGKEVHTVEYQWNPNGTVAGVKSGAGEFRYGYDPKSPQLLASLTGPVLKTTYAYEPDRNLITEVNNHRFAADAENGLGELVSSYHYDNDAANRRSKVEIQPDDTVGGWEWSYNDRGELIGAKPKNDQLGTWGYEYDNLGNRIRSTEAHETVAYETNGLNQYTGIRRGDAAPEQLTHDSDGNLTADARGTYVWNAENRLFGAATADRAVAEYHYDNQGRRHRKAVTGPDRKRASTQFLYDGWNVLAEIDSSDPTASAPNVTYLTWGRDIIGTLHHTGGVGGLLAADIKRSEARANAVRHYGYDGNGNLATATESNRENLAGYTYQPYGAPLFPDAQQPSSDSWRFSTKLFDHETRTAYYGFRSYCSATGRWLSRDPLLEGGGSNLYAFVAGRPTSKIDVLGLQAPAPTEAMYEEYVRLNGLADSYSKELLSDASIEGESYAASSPNGCQLTFTIDAAKEGFYRKDVPASSGPFATKTVYFAGVFILISADPGPGECCQETMYFEQVNRLTDPDGNPVDQGEGYIEPVNAEEIRWRSNADGWHLDSRGSGVFEDQFRAGCNAYLLDCPGLGLSSPSRIRQFESCLRTDSEVLGCLHWGFKYLRDPGGGVGVGATFTEPFATGGPSGSY